jgi:hypothetical protein
MHIWNGRAVMQTAWDAHRVHAKVPGGFGGSVCIGTREPCRCLIGRHLGLLSSGLGNSLATSGRRNELHKSSLWPFVRVRGLPWEREGSKGASDMMADLTRQQGGAA